MKQFAAAFTLLFLAHVALGQDPLMVNSLNGVTQCQPIQISWTGGTAPYYLSLIPGGQPGGAPLKTFPMQHGNSYTWLVDLPAGTSFTTELNDQSGKPAYSGEQTIQDGSDSSCVNTAVTEGGSSNASSASSSGASGSSSAVQSSSAAAAVTQGGSSSSTSAASAVSHAVLSTSHSTSGTGTASSTTPASTSNGASHAPSTGAFGLAGVLGVLGAALF